MSRELISVVQGTIPSGGQLVRYAVNKGLLEEDIQHADIGAPRYLSWKPTIWRSKKRVISSILSTSQLVGLARLLSKLVWRPDALPRSFEIP